MKKYIIVESDIRNAFVSDSRNTRKHLMAGTADECKAYDRNGSLVSVAKRDPETGNAYNCYFDPEHNADMAALWAELNA